MLYTDHKIVSVNQFGVFHKVPHNFLISLIGQDFAHDYHVQWAH